MKQTNFGWGRVPLSIFMLFLLGLSPIFSQQLIFTSPDRDPNTAGHQQCANNDVDLQTTGLNVFQTVLGYQQSDDNGITWSAFSGASNFATDLNQPIVNGRRYRVEIFDAFFLNAFFLPGGGVGAGGNGAGPSPVTVLILPNITNPAIVAPMMVCQDNPSITLTASANNDINPPPASVGPRFDITANTPGFDACQTPGTLGVLTGVLNFNEGFWGTITVRARFQGCDANGEFRASTSALAVNATSTITVKRTFDEVVACALDPTPTIITGPTAVCEGETQKYTAFNQFAFPSPAGHTYEFSLDNPGAGVIATPQTASMTNITWTNLYTGGLVPVQVSATAWGCKNPAGPDNAFAAFNATGVLPVFICNRPILKTLTANKVITCAGECINIFVMFDFVNGSTGSFIVNYTVNGVGAQTIIPANSNNALLTSLCAAANYTIVITSVQNNNILELVPNGDGTFTSKFNNCTQTAPFPAPVTVTVSPLPVVNTITSSVDEDLALSGVQKCEDAAVNITLTAGPVNAAFTYVWKKDGVTIPGAITNTLTFPAVSGAAETSVYEVIVSTAGCTVTASKTINVTILKKPVLNSLTAEKTTACEGECVNFFVGFNYATGSNASMVVNYTINAIPQAPVTIPAGSNPALLKSICGTVNYTVAITSVSRASLATCTQMAAFPAPVSVTVIPNNKILTLTGAPDEDLIAPGVQKCEGGSITLTATAAGSMLLYTWTKNGNPVQGPSTQATLTFPATLANPANLLEINAYTVIVEGKCGGPDAKTIIVTIYKQPVGGTIAPALTKVCGAVPVTLNLTGQIGTVKKWQSDAGCTGVFTDIAGTAGLTTFTVTTVPNTITCYRAVVGNGTCPDVFSTTARVEADAPAVGGILTLASNTAITTASICPNQNVVLKVSGYTGKILNWQSNPIVSPVWVNIPGTANNINLTVNGSSIATTTFFRVCICSPLSICTGPAALAYSSVFRVSKKTNCAPPPPAPAPPSSLVQNTNAPGSNAVISKAFPIPTNHRVTLEIEGASEGDAQIEVLDLMGKVAIKETRFLQFGTNEVSFDISKLSSGIYIVKFMDSEKHQSSIKITKAN